MENKQEIGSEYLSLLNTEESKQLMEIIKWNNKMFPPKPPQYIRETSKVGRNDICPCGSNFKYKQCCIKSI